MSTETMNYPGLGPIAAGSGLVKKERGGDGRFTVGRDGVLHILATGDDKVEFIVYGEHSMAYVRASTGYPACYPVHPVQIERPVEAVLMDLDGTSVRSEHFWIWIIQLAIASLLGDSRFELEEADLPHVSGHSVLEHLQYCIEKYCPDKPLEDARAFYFEHTHREMAEIMAGRGKPGAFTPTPGLKDFLLELKNMGVRIGLVTSGLYEKAYPEILSAFDALGMGDPMEFYDAIITAGFPLRPGEVGTLGELSPKPHPWLYAETSRVGLGIPFENRGRVIGVEDSGAGICSIRLAGFGSVGLSGGNIVQSGTKGLCDSYCDSLEEVLAFVKDGS